MSISEMTESLATHAVATASGGNSDGSSGGSRGDRGYLAPKTKIKFPYSSNFFGVKIGSN